MSVDVAFIGVGGRSSSHLDTLEEMDDADVVAVCDIDEDAAEAAAEPHGSAVYTDHEELFADEDFDALFVGLPPFAHTDQEVMAAERGVDLFVEKPIALSNEKANEILGAIEANGVIAQVGYQRRYADAVHEAADVLEGRPIGMIEGWWKGGVPGTPWWRVYEQSGGQVVEQATHIYDMARFFGGDVAEVTAYGSHRIVEEVDFDDCVTANLRHESGVVTNLANSSAASDGKVGTEVLAEDAQLFLRGNSFEGVVDGEEVSYEGEHDPSVRQVEQFVAAVDRGDDSLVNAPYADAAKTLAVTLAVNESLENDGAAVTPGGV